jgi:hypothetical protein
MLRGCLTATLLSFAWVLSVAQPAHADERRPCPDSVDISETPGCPESLPYRTNDPIPRGYQLVERPRKGPLISGAIVFGIPYALSLVVAASNRFQHGSGYLVIPFFGPIAAAKALGPSCEFNDRPGDCGGPIAGQVLLLDSLVQIGGGVLMLIGLGATRSTLVRNDLASVTIVPRLQPTSGYGATIVGTF